MDRKVLIRFAIIGVISSLLTTLVVGSAFLVIIHFMPQIFMPSTSQLRTGALSTEANVVLTVKEANPAVVSITVSKYVPVYEQYIEHVPIPFRNFLGEDFFMRVPQYRQSGTERQDIGGGSGFLVSDDGYIVTNHHVVEDREAEYTVFTNDGEKHQAKVVSWDKDFDLALLKIDGNDFHYLKLGNSDKLEVGQTVIAIGNALAEFRNTVSVGVISGLSRSIIAANSHGGSERLDQLIQTDAAINEGNSGGPLLNIAGEVIGVNVAVVTDAENVGFAISSNSVRDIVEYARKAR